MKYNRIKKILISSSPYIYVKEKIFTKYKTQIASFRIALDCGLGFLFKIIQVKKMIRVYWTPR